MIANASIMRFIADMLPQIIVMADNENENGTAGVKGGWSEAEKVRIKLGLSLLHVCSQS
jgi:hypothetical protein